MFVQLLASVPVIQDHTRTGSTVVLNYVVYIRIDDRPLACVFNAIVVQKCYCNGNTSIATICPSQVFEIELHAG